jgi:hypothetical protein
MGDIVWIEKLTPTQPFLNDSTIEVLSDACNN